MKLLEKTLRVEVLEIVHAVRVGYVVYGGLEVGVIKERMLGVVVVIGMRKNFETPIFGTIRVRGGVNSTSTRKKLRPEGN